MPPAPNVWPTIKYADAPAAIRFLVSLGFEEAYVVPGEKDGSVAHAQLRWPLGGGVMLGSTGEGDPLFAAQPAGAASTYVVTDEPDAVLARATAARAEVARPMIEEDYGSRGFTVRDPEGNLWSFGTYRGE